MGLALGMQLFLGPLADLVKANPRLTQTPPLPQGAPLPGLSLAHCRPITVEKLPLGDTRHQLFVVLGRGDFLQGRKTSAKNCMVRVSVCDSRGNAIPATITRATVRYGLDNACIASLVPVRIPLTD
jgi:hypothetical protein